jgi:hypothetical protein
MEAILSSETSEPFYEAIPRQNLEERDIYRGKRTHLKFMFIKIKGCFFFTNMFSPWHSDNFCGKRMKP